MKEQTMYSEVFAYCASLQESFDDISITRQGKLQELGNHIVDKIKQEEQALITVICTHNSRRSHFGQLWLAVAAEYFGIAHLITSFSGGTEATALFPEVVHALQRAGFHIPKPAHTSSNPTYIISWSNKSAPCHALSKKYFDSPNPQSNFIAIMVCEEANEACPVVFGADMKVALPYEDPKRYDDTPQKSEQYDLTCRLIAKEMLYVMSNVKDLLNEKDIPARTNDRS